MTFEPNKLTFEDGLRRIEKAISQAGGRFAKDRIITSRNAEVMRVVDLLKVENVPNGFKKWQLPVHLDGPSQFFISVAAPDVAVPTHSHDEGDGFRYIVGGSIIYDGQELVAGDWMFIPKGVPYDFKTGPFGSIFCYCYQCCCA